MSIHFDDKKQCFVDSETGEVCPRFKPVDLRPDHYGGESHPFEAIKVIEAHDLNFSLGNVIKYVLRCGKKENANEIEDLEKARTYLKFEIERRKRNG